MRSREPRSTRPLASRMDALARRVSTNQPDGPLLRRVVEVTRQSPTDPTSASASKIEERES